MQSIRKAMVDIGAVFWVTVAISAVVIAWGAFFKANFAGVTGVIFSFIVSNLSWLYMLAADFFLVFVIVLALSRFGKIRLGREGDEPEFGRFSWFAMLFQAGMGQAIIFWGVAEPLSHYTTPPFGMAQPKTAEAAEVAMQYSFFHWALHPWAMYAVVGLAVAYLNYRRNEPGLISPVFRPLIGDRVDGPIGKAIDVLAILATLFGVAVSLGQAGLQVTAGLGETFGTPTGIAAVLIIIGVTTVAFMLSASTPLEYGIKWLANISMIVAPVLLLFFLIVGPTIVQINAFTQGMGDYLGNIVPMSLRMDSFSQDTSWLGTWTVFYWSWWIAWCPYVGLFIARISRGRTIREFILGVVLVPSLVTVLWFAVLGGAAIKADQATGGAISSATLQNEAVGMFAFIGEYPIPLITSIVTLLLVWIFFVAGADAGTVVLGGLSSGGAENPRRWVRLTWGAVLAGFAAVLIVIGGLTALTSASVIAGFPFAIIMVLMCFSLYRYLSQETREEDRAGAADRARDGAAPEPERATRRARGAAAPQQARAIDPEERR